MQPGAGRPVSSGVTDTMTTETLPEFESQICGRCHGTGTYSYTQSWGSACFGCGRPHKPGSGRVLTKRGAAARAFYDASLCRPASTVTVGERVFMPGVPGIPGMGSRWGTVTAIEPYEQRWREGEGEWQVAHLLAIVTDAFRLCESPEGLVRVGWSAAAKREKWLAAIAYQATLTKTGTVRKRSAKPAAVEEVRS